MPEPSRSPRLCPDLEGDCLRGAWPKFCLRRAHTPENAQPDRLAVAAPEIILAHERRLDAAPSGR